MMSQRVPSSTVLTNDECTSSSASEGLAGMLFKCCKLAELAGCPLLVLRLSMTAQLLCHVRWKTTRRCDGLWLMRTTWLAENDQKTARLPWRRLPWR